MSINKHVHTHDGDQEVDPELLKKQEQELEEAQKDLMRENEHKHEHNHEHLHEHLYKYLHVHEHDYEADAEAAQSSVEPQGVSEEVKEPKKVTKDMVSDDKRKALARWYVMLIDRSFSMTISDQYGGERGDRWGSAEKIATDLLDTVFEFAYENKLPTYLFGSNAESIGTMTRKEDVLNLFQKHTPEGSTNLSETLDLALSENFEITKNELKEFPGMTVIVITDGQPDSEAKVKDVMLK